MIAFLILGFTTICMNWLTISTKIKDENIREAVKKYSGKTSTSSEMDFTDIFDADDEHELVTGNSINDYSNVSASDTILYAFHTMQYAGIIGYIFICLASVLLFVNRKYGAMLALLASIAFLTALIGDVVWCYKQTDNIDDLLGTMGISAKNIGVDYSIHIGIGAVIALVSSIAATITGLLPGSSKKRAY